MAVMPGVDYRPINYSGAKRMTRYDVVCVHTIVGNDPAPAAHFSVRSDGYITQNRDTFYQSAANYQGNYRVIAIENDDHDANTPTDNPFPDWGGSDVPAMTDAQCESNARIAAWAYQAHGVPLVACPDSRSTSRGVGYHRLGIDGNWAGYAYGGRVSDGEHWSTSYGKGCPGDRRIQQTLQVVIPRARVLAGLDVDRAVVEEAEVIVVTCATPNRCGLLRESGLMIDITNSPTARNSAQARIEGRPHPKAAPGAVPVVWAELQVDEAAWDALTAVGL